MKDMLFSHISYSKNYGTFPCIFDFAYFLHAFKYNCWTIIYALVSPVLPNIIQSLMSDQHHSQYFCNLREPSYMTALFYQSNYILFQKKLECVYVTSNVLSGSFWLTKFTNLTLSSFRITGLNIQYIYDRMSMAYNKKFIIVTKITSTVSFLILHTWNKSHIKQGFFPLEPSPLWAIPN
jgi:hypothetical protein